RQGGNGSFGSLRGLGGGPGPLRYGRRRGPAPHAVSPPSAPVGGSAPGIALLFLLGPLLRLLSPRLRLDALRLRHVGGRLGVLARLNRAGSCRGRLRLGLRHPFAVVLHVTFCPVPLFLREPSAIHLHVAERLARLHVIGSSLDHILIRLTGLSRQPLMRGPLPQTPP